MPKANPRIAIIGAGISGLTLARALKDHAEVVVYEKARGVGGRMSTRYADPFYFDHGTQFFTARTPEFQAFLAPYIARGTVQEWIGRTVELEAGAAPWKREWFEPHYVASPNMNSLCKAMAEGISVVLSTEIAPLSERTTDGWALYDANAQLLGMYDWVISTAPPAQTHRLFNRSDIAPQHVHLLGCYALMLGLDRPWQEPWIAAKVRSGPLAWIAVNSTKPGRNAAVTSLVVHASNHWSEIHIDGDVAQAQEFLLKALSELIGITPAEATYVSTHRWRYALLEEPQRPGHYLDTASQCAATGDWASDSRIEDAWGEAMKLAARMHALIA